MKIIHLIAAACVVSSSLPAQNSAIFENFTYQGVNRFEDQASKDSYQNPILAGFMPDPSICRKGDDYYLVNSSFSFYPGVPIWHSKDLVNWTQIGHVLNRESQLKIGRSHMSGGVYAPDIKYNPHNNLFYVITTGTGYGRTSIVTTDDPKKQNWSDPIALNDVRGIDPSLFFDEDGKAYILNNDAPAYPAEYDGHRAIWIREFDWRNNKVIGQAQVVIDKGIRPADKPIWIEGPHLYKIKGLYYLMCAEGGTADWHSEVVLTSDKPFGPYTPCPINPILTQRLLPRGRQNPVTSAGHADLVQTAAGDWYAVFLACMPYRGGLYNTGRETFFLPVSWKDNQPIILENGLEVPYFVKKSEEQLRLEKTNQQKGFDFYRPGPLWTNQGLKDHAIFVRNPNGEFYSIDKDGRLKLSLKEVSLNESLNPAFICQRVTSWLFTATVALDFKPSAAADFAGIALFQNERFYMQFGKAMDSVSGNPIILLEAFKEGNSLCSYRVVLSKKSAKTKLALKVQAVKPDSYVFSYSSNKGKTWIPVGKPIDATILSTQVATGFQGASVGVYATSKLNRP
jgi:xylan 1,4-beta-xylosidase